MNEVYADNTFAATGKVVATEDTTRGVEDSAVNVTDLVTADGSLGVDGTLVLSDGEGKSIKQGLSTQSQISAVVVDAVRSSGSFSQFGSVIIATGSGRNVTSDTGCKVANIAQAVDNFPAAGKLVQSAGANKNLEDSGITTTDVSDAISTVGTLSSDVSALQAGLATAESNIDGLGTGLTAAEGAISGIQANYVSAASGFGTDNALLRADGTGRGAQPSTATITDTGTVDLRASSSSAQTMIQLRDHTNAVAGGVRILSDGSASFLAGSGRNFHIQSGSGPVQVTCSPTEIVFNEPSQDLDFRVESDSLTHMIFVDANSTTTNIALLAGAVPNWQSMVGGLFIANGSAVPTGNPTGGGFLYVEDGAIKWRGSAGTVTTMAPA